MKQKVAFIGAGSHSDAVKPHLDIYNYEFVGYFDDKDIEEYKGYPILGKTNDVLKCLHEKKIDKVFITIGDNEKRKELFDLVDEKYPNAFINIVSREATILTDSSIRGKGIFISRCFIGSEVEIYDNSIVNTGAIVEHHTVIAPHCNVTPGAILNFDGKPLIFHTIDAAIESGCFSKEDIYVSSDSQLYLDICKTRGISTILRDPELSKDTTPSNSVGLDFLSRFDEDVVYVLLQLTSPLRSAKQIQEAMKLFEESREEGVENVVSYVELDKSPRLFTSLDDNNYIQESFAADRGYRRQDEKKLYRTNGAIYITTKNFYEKNISYLTPKTKAYLMDKESSYDIDDRSDFIGAIGSRYFNYELREQRNKKLYKEKYKEFKNTELKENIIFGDSRLVNLELEGYSNLSLGGVTLATLLENLEQYNDVKIKKMLVSLGVNDIISNYNKEIIKENYKKLLLEIDKSNIELTLTTIGYALFRDSVDNEIVRELNEWLENFTRENKIKLIDINKELSEDYHLKYEYTNDGLHYNDKGSYLLYCTIKECLYV